MPPTTTLPTPHTPLQPGAQTRIHLWNNSQLKRTALTIYSPFFWPPKLLPSLLSRPGFSSTCLPSSPSNIPPPLPHTHIPSPLSPHSKSYTTRASTCIIIGSQAPIPKVSVQQHPNSHDRSRQSKISRKYYGCLCKYD